MVGVPFARAPPAAPDEPPTCAASVPHVLYGVVGSPSAVAGLPALRALTAQMDTAAAQEGALKRESEGVILAISADLAKGTAAEAVPMALFARAGGGGGGGEGGGGVAGGTGATENWKDRAQCLCVGGCG